LKKGIWAAVFILLINPAISQGQNSCDLARADMNCDGAFSPTDVLLVLQAVYGGNRTFCNNPAIKGDLNCDGFRDWADADLIQRAVFAGQCVACPPPPPLTPDSRDSIILETKVTAPSSGPAAMTLRVWLTNKDTLRSFTLPLRQTTLSGDAYAVLAYPRTFQGMVTPLTNFFDSGSVAATHKYNGVSPDSFHLEASQYYSTEVETPNASRKGIWDIKFDSVTGSCGQILFDSLASGFFDNTVHFTDLNFRRLPVHFAAGVVTVNAVPAMQDLRVSIHHFGAATRGSWRCVRIQCRNTGSCAAAGTAVLSLPPQAEAVFGYGRGYPAAAGGVSRAAPVHIDGNSKEITWNVPSLAAGEGLYLWARYKIPCTIETGLPLLSSVQLEPLDSDADPTNNIASVSKPAVAGGAPCDAFGKAAAGVAYGEIFDLGAIDTLTYLILFENRGGGTAADVLVRDSLDANLDGATFDSAGASHPFSFGVLGDELSWNLDNINLPDSSTNSTGSVGFVAFRIRADAGLPEGTVIRNKAFLNYDGGATFVLPPAATPVCIFPRGDVNADSSLSPADVVALLNCVFLAPGGCTACADLNCDGTLSPAEAVIELNAVFLGTPIVCP
jgi:uncharacterized repeat protein (TIGR01451 family)